MIKEWIIVEGKDDIAAVKRALNCEVIATGGTYFNRGVLELIQKAAQTSGIIILTDPDYAGKKIRDKIDRLVPGAKHAFIERVDATRNEDIGVENASPEVIRLAIERAMPTREIVSQPYQMSDLYEAGLVGGAGAATKRAFICERLGIGHANAKQLLVRLNRFGISKADFLKAVEDCDDK